MLNISTRICVHNNWLNNINHLLLAILSIDERHALTRHADDQLNCCRSIGTRDR